MVIGELGDDTQMINIEKVEVDLEKRMIVISDIHGSLKLLQTLLEKIDYTDDDYLFINGDLAEKGKNSLEVIEFIKNMDEKSNRVFVSKGNCDIIFKYVLDGNERILSYMRQQQYSLLNEMIVNEGKSMDDFSDIESIAEFYRNHYQDMFDWLDSLPEAYETDDHIIIHAGINGTKVWRETDELTALSAKAFYENGHQAEKVVIVGHWPVVNYRTNLVSSNNPLIDLEKKVISLDGGNQIKIDGQLNALIIKDGMYSDTYVDELTIEKTVQTDFQNTTAGVGTVTYPNYELRVIQPERYFTLCENAALGIRQWVKNEYLTTNDNVTYSSDVSTTFLSVQKGERVKVINASCEGYVLIKKINGDTGWISKSCLSGE